MDTPSIIHATESDKEQVKGVLKLGFANDALLRWVFPDAKAFLESFDHWMEEYSKYFDVPELKKEWSHKLYIEYWKNEILNRLKN